jgi:hypothetical protein
VEQVISVELEFGMGRTNDTNNLNFPIIGLQKEQEWVGASSNVDASVIFKSVSNQTASEAMRILSSGNVGIGTSSPQYPLEVTGVTLINGNLVITGGTDTADRRASITHDGSSMILKASGNSTNRNIIFERSGDGSADETMRIDSSGNVGIGTTAPDALLSVNGVASFGDGTALLPSIANFGDLNTGMWFPAADTIAFSEGGAERMRITSSGNVGIGTSSPDKLLTVASNSGTSVPTIRILDTAVSPTTNDVNGSLEFYTNDGDGEHLGAYISCIANEVYGRVNSLVFGVSQSITADATEALRIQSNGNVGINTTAPDAKLSVNGVASFGDGTALLPSIANFGNLNTGMWFPAADTIAFSEGGAEAMRIDSSGRVGIGTSSPSEKLVVERSGAGNVVRFTDGTYGVDVAVTSTGGSLQTGNINQTLDFKVYGNGYMGFYTSGTSERMRILSGGNVGIGTTTPDATLSVNGVASFGDGTALLPSIANFGDLNTGMWFPDADTIAFSEGGVEAMRIDSSGRLLINTTSTILDGSEKFAVDGGHASFQFSNTPLLVNKTGTDGSIVSFRKDGTVVGNIGVINSDNLYISGYTAHAGIQFGSETVAPMSAGVATNNTIDLGGSGNAYRDLYLGGGLYVGGTVAANKLDDYEEGTWTPTLTGAGSNPTVSYSTQLGKYTKIGNAVTVYFQCFTSSVSGGSGRLRISGLPFTSNSDNKSGAALGYFSFVNLNAGYTRFGLEIGGSGTHLLGSQSGDNVSAIVVNVTEAGNAFNVLGTCSYFV